MPQINLSYQGFCPADIFEVDHNLIILLFDTSSEGIVRELL